MIEPIIGAGIFVALIAVFESFILAEVRHEIDKEADQSMVSAVRAVLNTVCDVVVELDSELCLTEDVPELATVLLMNRSHSLRGTPLGSFMPLDCDQREFERHMSARLADDVGMADVLHTRLRDACGSIVSMEMFSVPLVGLDLRPRYNRNAGIHRRSSMARSRSTTPIVRFCHSSGP